MRSFGLTSCTAASVQRRAIFKWDGFMWWLSSQLYVWDTPTTPHQNPHHSHILNANVSHCKMDIYCATLFCDSFLFFASKSGLVYKRQKNTSVYIHVLRTPVLSQLFFSRMPSSLNYLFFLNSLKQPKMCLIISLMLSLWVKDAAGQSLVALKLLSCVFACSDKLMLPICKLAFGWRCYLEINRCAILRTQRLRKMEER